MKKKIILTALLLAPQLSHAMELEKKDFKPENVSQEDYEKFLPAALFCAVVYHERIKPWFDKNYFFDEFYMVHEHLKNLEPNEKTIFENTFKSLDDKTINNKIALYRILQKNTQEEDFSHLEQLFSLFGYAENQPQEYSDLPRELRSFYSRFFTWPKLLQDDAILRGIENHQITGLKRIEFTEISAENMKRLEKLFAKRDYDIKKPENSTCLEYKNLEETTEAKSKLKAITKILGGSLEKE